MKTLMMSLLGTALIFAASPASASTASVTSAVSLGAHDDLFENAIVDDTSPLVDGFTAVDAFGAETPNPVCPECALGGRVIFAPDENPFIDFHTAAPVTLAGFNVYASGDGSGVAYRGFSTVRLLASADEGRTFTDLLGEMSYDPASGYVRASMTFDPTTAQFFRFEGVALNGGARLVELDGLAAAVPEPATWALMILGFGTTGFAMRRRRHTTAAPRSA